MPHPSKLSRRQALGQKRKDALKVARFVHRLNFGTESLHRRLNRQPAVLGFFLSEFLVTCVCEPKRIRKTFHDRQVVVGHSRKQIEL